MMTKMKWTLAAALVLGAMATPGYCGTVQQLDFTTGTTGGTFSTTNGTSLNSLSGVSFTQLAVVTTSGTTDYTITSGSLSLTGGYLVLSGDIASLGINTATTLAEVAVGNATLNGSNPDVLSIGTTAGIFTYGSTLLSDLGITGIVTGTCTSSTGCFVDGAGGSDSGTSTWTAFSEGINTNVSITAAPEPVSLLLAGGGLLMVGLARRKRKA